MTTATTAETLSAAARAQLRMSYEEYLAWEHEGSLSEWVEGEVIVHMPPMDYHQRVVGFVFFLLEGFVNIFRLGKVRVAPLTMRITSDGPAREPDIMFVASDHLARLTSRALEGPADLVVEVISDDSVGRDRADKFYEYQEGGVGEYWIIDPRPGKERVDFYVLDERQRYQPVPVPGDGVYRSTVLAGLWLRVDWLWQENPNTLAALAEVVGSERMIAALGQERDCSGAMGEGRPA